MTLRLLIAAAAGGAFGSVGRYVVTVKMGAWFGTVFPFGTMTVNIAGSFLMGVLFELFTGRFPVSEDVRVFVLVGILGGFTTFSSFSLDAARLIEEQMYLHAFSCVAVSVFAGLAALFGGLYLSRTVF